MRKPEEILEIIISGGEKTVKKSFSDVLLLSFVGGALVALGYLAYIRIIASMLDEWGSIAILCGACIFPIGLICIKLCGGELETGNMMSISCAWYDKRINSKELLISWLIVTFGNFLGAVFVAYVFGHLAGFTTKGVFLEATLKTAAGKYNTTALQAFISGIGCNWFVGMAVWISAGAKDTTGKILGLWFPVMTFVAMGFQNSIANLFIIPAAIFEGGATWLNLIENFCPVFLGNIVGGSVFVGLIYYKIYKKALHKD